MKHTTSFRELPLPGLFDIPRETPDVECSAERHDQMCKRLIGHGIASVQDVEMLELVLGRAIGRDADGILASRLLARFGDFNHTVAAPPEQLREVAGVTDKIINELKIVEAAAHRMARGRIVARNVIGSWDALIEYCATSMAHADREIFRVFFLDRKNVLIADEDVARGTVDHVPVYPREVARRALLHSASAVILVHNHPSGDPAPSDADVSMTHRILDALLSLDVTLHDHLVIGKGRSVSFRQEGLI